MTKKSYQSTEVLLEINNSCEILEITIQKRYEQLYFNISRKQSQEYHNTNVSCVFALKIIQTFAFAQKIKILITQYGRTK